MNNFCLTLILRIDINVLVMVPNSEAEIKVFNAAIMSDDCK